MIPGSIGRSVLPGMTSTSTVYEYVRYAWLNACKFDVDVLSFLILHFEGYSWLCWTLFLFVSLLSSYIRVTLSKSMFVLLAWWFRPCHSRPRVYQSCIILLWLGFFLLARFSWFSIGLFSDSLYSGFLLSGLSVHCRLASVVWPLVVRLDSRFIPCTLLVQQTWATWAYFVFFLPSVSVHFGQQRQAKSRPATGRDAIRKYVEEPKIWLET